MRYLLFSITAIILGLAVHAQDIADGEWGFKYDGTTPNMIGQCTGDHLFVQGNVSFFTGDTQTVWFYLNDDEIYQNSKVQALTPMRYNSAGDLYNEITYNSFQCDLYLPEGISITAIEDEDGYDVDYVGGDRMPTTSTLNWSENGTKVIDGKTYNVYSLICYNANSVGCHLSAKNAARYKANGALKKEHTLFALFLHNDNQDQAQSHLDQDLIIANQIFNIYESVPAGWDANASTFFYGTGGNNETQVFMRYDRTGMYGSSGYDRNYFFLPDTATLHGKTITLPVRMQNEDAVSGFQTELHLPDGFSIVKQQEQYQIELTDRKATDHTLQVEQQEGGIIRITSQSPSHAAYSGQDGALFNITLQVPSAVDSTYVLHLNNTLLTGTDGQILWVNDATGSVTVCPYNTGDVNNNGYYTVGDVVVTSRHILGMNPSPFYPMAADLDQNGLVTGADLPLMSQLVLEDETPWSALTQSHEDIPGGLLIRDLEMTAGSSMTVDVLLEGFQDITAFQTDIMLSDGLSINLAGQQDAFVLTDRASQGHLIDNYIHENDAIRVMAYTPDVTAFAGNEGALFTFKITADEDFAGPGTITLTRTLLSTVDGQDLWLEDTACTVKKALRGDVNGDGVVNVADINAVVNIILGGKTSPEIVKRADVNGDGMINISDVNLLISIILA